VGRWGGAAKRFLTEALHVSSGQANRGLAAAKATRAGAAELPGMGAALAEGEVSREHMDGAVTAARKFPKPVKEKILPDRRVDAAGRPVACRGIEALDDLLSDEARRAQPSAMDLLARKLLHELDPDRLDRFDPDAFERITCTISTDFAGLTTFRLVSDPVNAMLITAAIKRRNAPRPPGTSVGENGETVVVPDTRLPGQRTAEAMIELLLAGAGLQPATPSTDPSTDPDDLVDPDGVVDPVDLVDLSGGCIAGDGAEATGPTAGAKAGAQGGAKGGTAGSQRPLAEVLIVARLGEVLAAQAADATSPAGRARAARAGLARMSLAGTTGTCTGSTIDPAVLAQLMCTSSLRRIIIDDREG